MRDKDNFADAQLTISRGSVAFDAVAGLVQGGIVHLMNPFSWLQMTNMISYQGLVRTFLNRTTR
jgi:hypothetical protein